MNTTVKEYVEQFMADVVAKNPNEPEFHQAVREVLAHGYFHTALQHTGHTFSTQMPTPYFAA